jgi:hypothetical protein
LRAAFALLDVDGVAIGAGAPSVARRLHSAAQMLKSCGAPTGGREERLAYLEEAFGATREAMERDWLPRLRAHAKKERLEIGL